MSATQKYPSFMDWWQEVNDHLAQRGVPEMLYGDARWWFNRRYTPPAAAELHAEERLA